MTKEYDCSMTIDEVIARLREKTAPYSINPFRFLGKEWALLEYSSGTFGIEKKMQSRYSTHGSLTLLPAVQGTHLILETNSMWKFFCLAALIIFEMSPVMIYISVRRGGSAGFAISGVVFIISFTLICALLNRVSEKDLIDFFEADILGIKKRRR